MNPDWSKDILDYLLDRPGVPTVASDSPERWREAWRALCRRWTVPADRALAGGRMAESLAGAFAAGYQAAIDRLVPDLAPEDLKAFCVTETDGVHPRAVRTRLTPVSGGRGMVLNGVKSFVTGADRADWLLVACSMGAEADGRNRIVLVTVSRRSPGVALAPISPLAFVPEISHAAVRFSDVAIDKAALLPGEGWTDYVKPFRTVEDIHVTGAVTGYLIGVGRRSDWPASAIEEGLGLAVALRDLAPADPSSPACHLALGGILTLFEQWLERLEGLWSHVDETVRRRWQRDRPLLGIAAAARCRRLASARGKFFG